MFPSHCAYRMTFCYLFYKLRSPKTRDRIKQDFFCAALQPTKQKPPQAFFIQI